MLGLGYGFGVCLIVCFYMEVNFFVWLGVFFAYKSRTVALFKLRLCSSLYSISSPFFLLPWVKNNTGKQLILDSWEFFFWSLKKKQKEKHRLLTLSLPGNKEKILDSRCLLWDIKGLKMWGGLSMCLREPYHKNNMAIKAFSFAKSG